jgi:hypothetical protein
MCKYCLVNQNLPKFANYSALFPLVQGNAGQDMATATKWWATKRVMTTATKRAMVTVARVMVMATMAKAPDREGNGNGSKSNDSNEEGKGEGGKGDVKGNKCLGR